ncbi:hypothetical protein [Pontibacter sp. SGAir0037]|uniref:hypothetical protein n=1 Tax=Pontibacter sp. SGAir0037 TaxID=2571030 RepID=UPI0010CD44D0|nr:hypothetical protein [Pontibacter sp. SGAir0037]QCR23498.1 hypothetical protein C1N53_14875 [Pontibacter sp. SGAir0037]
MNGDNKDLAKGQEKQDELTKKSQSNSSDTSNSLERDAKGDPGVNNYTPQNRTDNEQDNQK